MAPLAHLFALLGLLVLALSLPSPGRGYGAAKADRIGGGTTTGTTTGTTASLSITNADAANLVSDCYIVVYRANCTDDEVDAHEASIRTVMKKHNLRRRSTANTTGTDMSMKAIRIGSWRAVSLRATERTAMASIASSDTIRYVEQDARVSTTTLTTQSNATTGLARLSHAAANASATSYVYDSSAGAGITAYVVDTGILVTHGEFAGRATFGANFANSVDTDENGHGSHVAGTIGGTTYGVAKSVSLVAVKVLDADGAGTNSDVIAGIEWAVANATARGLAGKAVLNMSLGGSLSAAVNAAVAAVKAAGIVACVAAGNDNVNAKNSSPASSTEVITVGAMDQTTDQRASFSNFGASVDVFAPGVDVLSVGITSNTATDVLSGTSMASPHIAGLAAYLMALENITDPDAVQSRIVALANTTGASITRNRGRTTNLIANNGEL